MSSLTATKWTTTPEASTTGEMEALSQNRTPDFLRLHSSPCHSRPERIVLQSSAYWPGGVMSDLSTLALRPSTSAAA